jgi:hypothetical protein
MDTPKLSQFKLIEILDAHSKFKSEIAKQLVNQTIESFDIKYSVKDDYFEKCKNTIRLDKKTQTPKVIDSCNHAIKDVFLIQNTETEEEIRIGNHCIADLVTLNLVVNVNYEQIQTLFKLLNTNNICIICNTTCNTDIIHKACLKGITTRKIDYCKEQIKFKYKLKSDLNNFFEKREFKYTMFTLRRIFQGVNGLNLKFSQLNKDKINNLKEKYSVIFDNQTKLLELRNNCIVKSIMKQRRFPSDKQIIMIERILQEYPKIRQLDRENTNSKYIKYGYVF